MTGDRVSVINEVQLPMSDMLTLLTVLCSFVEIFDFFAQNKYSCYFSFGKAYDKKDESQIINNILT